MQTVFIANDSPFRVEFAVWLELFKLLSWFRVCFSVILQYLRAPNRNGLGWQGCKARQGCFHVGTCLISFSERCTMSAMLSRCPTPTYPSSRAFCLRQAERQRQWQHLAAMREASVARVECFFAQLRSKLTKWPKRRRVNERESKWRVRQQKEFPQNERCAEIGSSCRLMNMLQEATSLSQYSLSLPSETAESWTIFGQSERVLYVRVCACVCVCVALIKVHKTAARPDW